jgi:hypothetical protein
VRQDVRQGAVHRGGQSAACQARCPEPALQLAQALLSEPALLSEQALRSGQQASPGALRGPQVPERVLPWAPAVPQDPLPEAAEELARAVAEPRRGAAWGPGVPRAVPEGEESARAAAGLQPAAATAASGRRAAVEAAAVPGGPQAAVGAEPDGPQVAAEAVGALRGAAVLQPAEAQRADGAAQPRAAGRPGARAPQAARPLVP